ncbi:hypothetical protein [Microbacterium sp. GXF6406]
MTDADELPEYTAAVALIEATGLTVHDSLRYDSEGRLARDTYLIAFPAIPYDVEQARFSAVPDFDTGITRVDLDIQAVATTARGATKALSRALRALVGQTLLVPRRSCDPIRLTLTTSAQDDRTIQPPLFYADGSVEITTRPGGTT